MIALAWAGSIPASVSVRAIVSVSKVVIPSVERARKAPAGARHASAQAEVLQQLVELFLEGVEAPVVRVEAPVVSVEAPVVSLDGLGEDSERPHDAIEPLVHLGNGHWALPVRGVDARPPVAGSGGVGFDAVQGASRSTCSTYHARPRSVHYDSLDGPRWRPDAAHAPPPELPASWVFG